MTGITTRPVSNVHWNILKHLPDDAKMELIMMLTRSLKHIPEHEERPASEFYGIWGDDGMSDDEFVNELKAARSFSQDIVQL